MAVFIYFDVKGMPHGQAEPEFESKGAEEIGQFHFFWAEAREIFRMPTMWFIFLQGFAGVFPWNVITFFFFGYLVTERGYDNNSVLTTMGPVILSAIFIFFAIRTPIEDRTTFFVLMCLTALFMPLSSPNVTATVYDITVPEVCSTAQAVEYFIENIGAVTAPFLAGASRRSALTFFILGRLTRNLSSFSS